MAFDFSKLRSAKDITPEERAAEEAQRRQRDIEADEARRRKWSSKTIEITLDEAPETRFTLGGEKTLLLRGVDDTGRAVRAQWYAPDHMERDDFDAFALSLDSGQRHRLEGYWKPYEGREGKKFFTFMAQFVHPLDKTPEAASSPSP